MVNNPAFEAVAAHLSRFNPIHVMKMQRMEIRHSTILGWLLDPQETHGFGDRFLRAFLGEALRDSTAAGGPSALDVTRADLRDATVRLEWRNIDLFVECPTQRWAFIIENKVGSRQHSDQLRRYFDRVAEHFRMLKQEVRCRGVLLSLNTEEPAHPAFCTLGYAAVGTLLRHLLAGSGDRASAEVRTFLNHYLEVVDEMNGVDAEAARMQGIARELYRENRRVLDFIIEHGQLSPLKEAAATLFGSGLPRGAGSEIGGVDFSLSLAAPRHLFCLPAPWEAALRTSARAQAGAAPWPGCENWFGGVPLTTWFELKKRDDADQGRIKFTAEVGPLSDQHQRRALIEAIQEAAEKRGLQRIGFRKDAAEPGRKYSRFFTRNIKPVTDVHDAAGVVEVMAALVRDFEAELDAVTGAVARAFA